MKKISQLAKNKFIQGGLIFTVANFFVSLFNYLFNSLSAKALGPHGYGEITALFSYQIIFSVPLAVIGTIIIRRIGFAGQSKWLVAYQFNRWFWEKTKKWFFIILIISPLFIFLPRFTNLKPITTVLLVSITLLGFIGSYYGAVFQGLQLFLAISLLGILGATIKFSGAMIAYLKLGGLTTIFIFLFLSALAPIIIAAKIINQKFKDKIKKITGSYVLKKRILRVLNNKHILITALSLLSISFIGNIDIIYVKKFFSADQAGLYSAWILFAKIITYVVGPLNGLALIFFSDKENKGERRKIVYLILILLFLTSLTMYFLYYFFPQPLIAIILSAKFSYIQALLPQAAVFGFFLAIITFFNTFFIAKQRKESLLIAFSAPFYLLAIYFFASSFNNLIQINIIYSLIVALIYLGALLNLGKDKLLKKPV